MIASICTIYLKQWHFGIIHFALGVCRWWYRFLIPMVLKNAVSERNFKEYLSWWTGQPIKARVGNVWYNLSCITWKALKLMTWGCMGESRPASLALIHACNFWQCYGVSQHSLKWNYLWISKLWVETFGPDACAISEIISQFHSYSKPLQNNFIQFCFLK